MRIGSTDHLANVNEGARRHAGRAGLVPRSRWSGKRIRSRMLAANAPNV